MIVSKVLKVDENIIQIKIQYPTSMEPLMKSFYVETSVKVSNDPEKKELLSYMKGKAFVEEMNIRISEDSNLIASGISIAYTTFYISETKEGKIFTFQ